MIRRTLGIAAVTYTIVFVIIVSAAAGYATGYDGCARTCGEARDFFNGPTFVWLLASAFAALLASIPMLLPTRRRD